MTAYSPAAANGYNNGTRMHVVNYEKTQEYPIGFKNMTAHAAFSYNVYNGQSSSIGD